MPHILTTAQAEAAYSAMCALNNVGGKLNANWDGNPGTFTSVFETPTGSVRIVDCKSYTLRREEEYGSQSAFAAAYGLQTGA